MICVEIGAGEMWTTEHSIETNARWMRSGPAISADFDDTLKALVEHAGR
jgi:hypothetical protein